MGKLKQVREKAGIAPRRDRTVTAVTLEDMRKVELETVSNSRRIVAEKEEKRENKFMAMTKLLPVTQLCCKRWAMVCTKLKAPRRRVKVGRFSDRNRDKLGPMNPARRVA